MSKAKVPPYTQSNTSEPPEQPTWGKLQKSFDMDVKVTLGKILTVIDSSYTNERQAKAIKDLVKDIVWKHQRTVDESIYQILEVPKEEQVPVSSSVVNAARSAADRP